MQISPSADLGCPQLPLEHSMMASASIMLLGSPESETKIVLRHWGAPLVLFLTAKPTASRPRGAEILGSGAQCCWLCSAGSFLLPCLDWCQHPPHLPGEKGVCLHVRLRLMDVGTEELAFSFERGLLQKAAGLKRHSIFMSPVCSPLHFCAPCLGVWQTIFATDALTGR